MFKMTVGSREQTFNYFSQKGSSSYPFASARTDYHSETRQSNFLQKLLMSNFKKHSISVYLQLHQDGLMIRNGEWLLMTEHPVRQNGSTPVVWCAPSQ